MKKTLLVIMVITATLFASCNNNVQKAAALQTNIDNANVQLKNLQASLSQAQVQLDVANSNLNSAQDFHLLRSNAKRQQDVQNAGTQVQQCRQSIMNIQTQIQQLNTNIFNWQTELKTITK